jgi:pimeloyl-ACP methyl ester carboxylesterase
LARRLAQHGLGPVYGFEYWSAGRVTTAAKELAAMVERVCEKHGTSSVRLIGHSLGGVVGRCYATLGGGAPRVRHLVTIGSPHGGVADLPPAAVGLLDDEVLVGGSLIAAMDDAGIPSGLDVTVIYSHGDALLPARRATIRGAASVVFDDIGHLSLLTSRRVIEEIVRRFTD